MIATCTGLFVSVFLATDAPADSQRSAPEVPGWGDLQTQFVYDGEPPAPTALNAPGIANVVDESLVVNKQNRGIANVVVWLRAAKGNPPPVHPTYDEAARAKVIWPIANSRYSPHVQAVRVSQTLVVRNQDPIAYNPHLALAANPPIASAIPAARDDSYTFRRPELRPTLAGCSIHPWMRGWLIVQDHPYVGVSDADGKLTIGKLPVGDWEFQFWHERCGHLSQVVVEGVLTVWPKGRREITIKQGGTEIGMFSINPALLKER